MLKDTFVSVPSAPMNVTTHSITNRSAVISWEEPKSPNGVLAGYRLYFMHDNFTDVRSLKASKKKTMMEYKLEGLGRE